MFGNTGDGILGHDSASFEKIAEIDAIIVYGYTYAHICNILCAGNHMDENAMIIHKR